MHGRRLHDVRIRHSVRGRVSRKEKGGPSTETLERIAWLKWLTDLYGNQLDHMHEAPVSLADWIRAGRPTGQKVCALRDCRALFTPRNKRHKYCSPACSKRKYWKRNKKNLNRKRRK